ncbi:MAG: hypothetical protein AB8B51_00015 [Sedimentitalea sp.]
MSTWISRALLLGALVLTGCAEGAKLPFAPDLSGISARAAALTNGAGRKRLAETALAGKDIMLAAPDGYCIDRRSLKRAKKASFAVVARCDSLGVEGYYDVFDLALITITTAPFPKDAARPGASDLIRAGAPAKSLDELTSGGVPFVRLALGGHQTENVSPEHWRGIFVLNGHLVALGLYAPDGSPALDRDGAYLLSDLARLTRRATEKAQSD